MALAHRFNVLEAGYDLQTHAARHPSRLDERLIVLAGCQKIMALFLSK
jgi:hypothetical protein